MNPSQLDKLKKLSIFTTSDAAKFNVTRAALSRAVEKGDIEKLQRGLYGYVGREELEMHSFAELHISEHSDQSFRDYPITHFGLNRSLIPRLSGHF
ncbi:type IV toxin-antitoxin system AbiEi family antitoxin domain-containing protein [Vibrio splendidus]|uniref:type IV toxin-antitoxin system AbiEi family antitoxin domain-containing protein n=1 Tax=Vibrio splendidus TaxID=29497 RepID=UPI001F535906|nr:type IV toxin-antitoxin system AbiEi family antitoxin domain-containing protein [Vibrio splendidus]